MVTSNLSTDVIETATGELVLRILGTNRNGQILRLKSRKCTIGSGMNCTLRLRGRNVASTHCLILRGEQRTTIRRWAADTRLNGQTFSDAELNAGDRLGIGPFEFEVVALEHLAREAASNIKENVSILEMNKIKEPVGTDWCDPLPIPSNPIQNDSHGNKTQNIDALMESLRTENAVIDLRIHQINQECLALEKEKETHEKEKTALLKEQNTFSESQKDFVAKQQAFLEEQNTLQAERQAFLEEQKASQAEQEAFLEEKNALKNERELLHVEKEELLVEKNGLEQQRDSFKAEQEEFQNQREAAPTTLLAAELDQLQIQREEWNSQCRVFEEQKQQWQADREATEWQLLDRARQLDEREVEIKEWAESMNASSQAIEASPAEITCRMQELENQKSELDARSEALKQVEAGWTEQNENLDLRLQELNRRTAELDARFADLDARSMENEGETTAREMAKAEIRDQREAMQLLQESLGKQSADLERLAAEFADECDQVKEERQAREDELARREQEFATRERELNLRDEDLQKEREQIETIRADLESQRREIAQERETFSEQQNAFERERQRWDEERAAAPIESDPSELETEEEASAQPPETNRSENAPVDLQEVFRRLGHNVEFSEDESEDRSESNSTDSNATNGTRASASPFTAAHDEDNESIDSYMTQLMQRLGVKQTAMDNAKATEDNVAARTLSPTADLPVETTTEPAMNRAVGGQRREPVGLSPRTIAPEKSLDLAALRDLANLSAHQALGRHDLKQLISVARSKLIVVAVASVAGLGLLWHWQTHQAGKLAFTSALASFLVALYWGLQYAVLTGRLILNRKGHLTLRKRRERLTSHGVDDASSDNPTAIAEESVNEEGTQEEAKLDGSESHE